MKHKCFPFILLMLYLFPVVEATKRITLEDIFREYKFSPVMLSGIRSMNDGENYTTLQDLKHINKYKYTDGEYVETIFSVNELIDPPFQSIEDYTFSNDETKLLITTGKENIYRHSFRASYLVYNIKTSELSALSEQGKQQLATFSPDGKHIAFVRNNNLFIKNLELGEEKQITPDGEKNKIIYGAPDWVYEEEFGFSRGFEWSPDSRRIAFYRFDEDRVREFNMTIYGGLYPEWYKFKYPKAGEENSIVSIHVYDLQADQVVEMNTGKETDIYIPRIKWTNNPEILSIIRLNRWQNKIQILHAGASKGESMVVYEESNKYYISEINDNTITYLKNGSEFLLISEISGWKHIYRYNFLNKSMHPVTNGSYDIGSIISIDEESGDLYFSSHEISPLAKHIYKISFDGSRKRKISTKDGWNEAYFSRNNRYYILEYSNANTPHTYSLHSSEGRLLRTIEDNWGLVKNLKEYGFQKKEFFSFTTQDGVPLNGYMIKPPNFEPNRKYPVLMYAYGGPESQLVVDRYSARDSWYQMLSQLGYLIVCVDNRGTDNRGEEFRKATYMQLGNLETKDQIETALYLGKQPFVDKSRIGIYGWSYGGYMSLLCLFKGADVFKTAISVAPVTNWRYYDTIYTERFMRTPQENPSGYDDNSPITHVDKMTGKLLLIHGMADDNVHLQNSAELVEKLVQRGKQFDMQFYPNRNHGIYGGNTTYHLYERMTNYLIENL